MAVVELLGKRLKLKGSLLKCIWIGQKRGDVPEKDPWLRKVRDSG
jgi:hypothetical protein